MRSELHKKSKLYSKYPFDPILRGSFFKFRKQYNKFCKQKQREFKANIIKKLENLHEKDPNAYWKLIKDLKEDKDEQDPALRIPHNNGYLISQNYSQLIKILFTRHVF